MQLYNINSQEGAIYVRETISNKILRYLLYFINAPYAYKPRHVKQK